MGDESKKPGEIAEGDGKIGPVPYKYELYAGASAEVIIGAEGSFVGGEELNIVLGAVQYLHAIEYLDFTLGFAQEGYLGHQTELGTARTEAHAEHMQLKGLREDITGNQSSIVALLEDVAADRTAILGMQTSVDGIDAKVQGEVTKAVGASTEALGAKVDAIGSKTDAIGSALKAAGADLLTLGEQTKLLGSGTDLAGTTTNLSGSINNIAGLITNI
ncbi:MAG: hypothetical protein LBN33_04180 [Desulfovibrio sp.]|jgi:type VI secretion system secreted protein VgrG|nr:hypothetical protein [Desulfovibrio sp.]